MADWALEAARRATHKKIDECPHCHESWNECGVCDGTVIAVAQALREAEARGMERAAKLCGYCNGKGEIYFQDPSECDECPACTPIRESAGTEGAE